MLPEKQAIELERSEHSFLPKGFPRVKIIWYWLWPSLVLVGVLYLFIALVYNQQTRKFDFKPGLESATPDVQGLFSSEKNNSFAYSWTEPEWSIEIPDMPQNSYKLSLVLLSLKQQPLTILDYRGNKLQKFTPAQQLQEYSFIIPSEAIYQHHLHLNFTSPGFVADDKRTLGVLLNRITLVEQKPNGVTRPPLNLAIGMLELGLLVSWLLMGFYLVIAGKRKRPLWPFVAGGLAVIAFYLPALVFPAYNNEFELRNLLDIPLFGLGIITAGIYLYAITPKLFALVSPKYPQLPLLSAIGKYRLGFEFRRDWSLLAAIGLVAIVFLLFSARFEWLPYPFDIDLYHKYGNLVVLDQALPFRNFYLEYPPFAVAFFGWPSLVENLFRADLPDRYLLLFQLQFFFITTALLFVMWKLLQKLYAKSNFSLKMAALTVTVFLSIYYIFGRFDIGPTFLVALAFYLIFSDRPVLGGVVLGLGAAAKLYPALYLPLLLIYFWCGRQERRYAFQIWAGFGVANLIVTLPFIVFGWSGMLNFLEYHSQRGIQIESYYASVIWVGNKLGMANISTEVDHGSDNIISDWSPALSQLSTYVIVVGLLAIYACAWWVASRAKQKKQEPEWLLQSALVITIWFIISNKVLSPQYMLWLLPFVPAIRFNKIWLLWGTLLLSTIAYPFMSKAVHNLDALPLDIILARNVFLLAFFCWQLWDFIRSKDQLNKTAFVV